MFSLWKVEDVHMKIKGYSQSYWIEGEGRLVEVANKYFHAAEVHGLSPDTVRAYAYGLKSFFEWIKSDWSSFEKMNQKTLQDWLFFLKSKKMQPRSINQQLVCVRAFYRFIFGQPVPHAAGVLYPNAYYRGPRRTRYGGSPSRKSFLELRVKVPREVINPIKPKEIDTFISNMNRYRDLAIVLTMLCCGLRSQEVILLRREDVDFHRASLLVRGKGKRERMVPLPEQLMAVYERYLNMERPHDGPGPFFVIMQGKHTGQILNRHSFRAFFWYHRKKLNLPKARPHQFRHAFASDLARVGVPLTTIQRLLGHADPRTSVIYIELFLDDIRVEYDRAIKKIEERYATFSKQSASGINRKILGKAFNKS